jgi:hypothetical protein
LIKDKDIFIFVSTKRNSTLWLLQKKKQLVILVKVSKSAIEKYLFVVCIDPDDFPLFGNSLCISRMLYTGLFLTNIILSGITFLLLIVNNLFSQ